MRELWLPQGGFSKEATIGKTGLVKESLKTKEGKPFVVEKISSIQALEDALDKRGMIETYIYAYGREPYNRKKFSYKEIYSRFSRCIEEEDGSVFVAVDEGEIIGFTAIRRLSSLDTFRKYFFSRYGGTDEFSWYISDMGIRRKYEGKGIAKGLLQNAIGSVSSDSSIALETLSNNDRAQGLYRRLGFKKISRISSELLKYKWVNDQLFMVLDRGKSSGRAKGNASGVPESGILFQQ